MIAGRKPAPRLSNLHGGACFERCDARSRRRVMISEVLGPEHRRSTAGSGRCDRGHWRARAPFGILDGEGDAEFNVGGSESTGSWRWSVGRRFGKPLVDRSGARNLVGSDVVRLDHLAELLDLVVAATLCSLADDVRRIRHGVPFVSLVLHVDDLPRPIWSENTHATELVPERLPRVGVVHGDPFFLVRMQHRSLRFLRPSPRFRP